jgi:hypothetical protein
MSAIKAFEKANRFVYGHIRKVAVVAAVEGRGSGRGRGRWWSRREGSI